METMTFAIEHFTDTPEFTEALKEKAERRLQKMARGHRDITGASVAVRITSADPSPGRYQARVVLYHRPDNIAAVEKGDNVGLALQGALDAVERQVRTQRERLRKY